MNSVPTLPAPPESFIALPLEASDWVLLPELQGTRRMPFSVGVKIGPNEAFHACVLWTRPNPFAEGDSSMSYFTDDRRGVAFAMTLAAALRGSARP